MIPDLHPEELLDKSVRGELSDSERRLLDTHLQQCAVCRFQVQTAKDFAAVHMPALDIDSLVTNALTARASQSAPARRPSRRFGVLAAALVATFAMGSFAAVGQWTGVLPRLIAAVTSRSNEPVAPAPVAPKVAPPVHHVDVAPPTPPPVIEAPPPPPPAPVQHAEVVRPAAPVSHPHVEAPAPVVEVTPDIPPAPPETSASVFAAANRARVDGDTVQAIGRYQRLLNTWPQSVEAPQTRATLGRLLLDQGDPVHALVVLDAYLAGSDRTLREEVLAARAQAFMRLGRGAEEQAAWRALLDEFPGSIHATRAHIRVGDSGTP